MTRQPLTLFSWGYWGWGNATRQLAEATSAAERSRGFGPPLFVDVRISRSVRAVGFNGHAFEQLLGPDGYKWLPTLGNKALHSSTGPAIQIADPAGAEALLDLAAAAQSRRRRIIFFCSCEYLIGGLGGACHRSQVSQLLEAVAQRRDIPFEVVEWPGGTPKVVEVEVSKPHFSAIRRGRASLPLPSAFHLGQMASLTWGSLAEVKCNGDAFVAVVGPARYQRPNWYLPVLERFTKSTLAWPQASRWAQAFRRSHGYESGELPPPKLHEACIYTIAPLDKLNAILATGGRGSLNEKRAWIKGRELLLTAMARGGDMAILFADATDCSRILFRARLTDIEADASGTTYAFEELRKLGENRTPQELTLLSKGEHIAPDFIRPYALCRTPAFIQA